MYSYKKKINLSFVDAIAKTKEALASEGFGVLTEINVQETLKKKLNVDYVNYIILGACNPSFAYQALKAEQEIGLLLPCNIIIYESQDSVFVSTILPSVAMKMVENNEVAEIARKVENKLKKVVDSI